VLSYQRLHKALLLEARFALDASVHQLPCFAGVHGLRGSHKSAASCSTVLEQQAQLMGGGQQATDFLLCHVSEQEA
jgi:hypothetical protein